MKYFQLKTAMAIAVLLATSATAQELKTAAEIIEFSSAKMATYKTWSADYTQSMRILGTLMPINGRLVQKQPRLMWMQMAMPMTGQKGKMTTILGEDGIMWQISEMGPQPQIMKVDVARISSNTMNLTGLKYNPLDQVDPTKRWEATRDIYDYRKVDDGKVDGQPVYVLEGLPKSGAVTNQQLAAEAARAGKVRISVGQGDGFVRRFEQYDRSQTNIVMAMEFKNLQFNPAISDSTFVYQPPTNTVVTDLTPSIEAQMRLQSGSAPSVPGSTAHPPAPSAPEPK